MSPEQTRLYGYTVELVVRDYKGYEVRLPKFLKMGGHGEPQLDMDWIRKQIVDAQEKGRLT